ncbi:TetR family transcriptional regulator [Corynebacterium sp. 335C]
MSSPDPRAELLFPRRRPAQARSRERFARILTAARETLVDVGFESFTFDEVAKRADVPIGTLYQFFANKYAMICELDRQDAAGVVDELRRFAQRVPALEWPEFLSEFIDHVAELWHDDVSRRAVWLAVQSTPATRATAADTESELIEAISVVLAPLMPHAEDEVREFIAGLLIHTTFSLLNFSVQNPSELGPDGVGPHYELTVQEVKRMLIAYLTEIGGAQARGQRARGPLEG